MFVHVKIMSIFGKKSGTSHGEIAVFCTVRECDATTPYYPISALSILNNRKFQTWSLSLTRDGRLKEVPKFSDLT